MEPSRTSFWVAIAVSQIVLGLVVFAATRHYYVSRTVRVDSAPALSNIPEIAWPGSGAALSPAESFTTALPTLDPAAVVHQADELFANQQYDRAAELYARALEFAPGNAELYNNLGLTLHYVGRSSEALERLAEGVAINPTHQRIWLTTGFIYAQTGNVADARLALNNAAMIDSESDVGRSAAEMLANLPP